MKFLSLLIIFSPLFSHCQLLGNKIPLHQSLSCEDKLFFNLYDSPTSQPGNHNMIATPDSGVIIIGEIRKTDPTDLFDSHITKINKQGNTEWTRVLEGVGFHSPSCIEKLNDGNYIVTGGFADNVSIGFFLFKISLSGNIIWRRDYNIPHVGERFGIISIKEDNDGSLIMASKFLQNGLSFSDRVLFIKTDNTGNILFSKYYTPADPITNINLGDLIVKDGYSYFAGGILVQNNLQGLLLKIHNTTGNLIWSKRYDFNNGPSNFNQIFSIQNNKLCLVGNDDINPKDTSIIYVIDTSGFCSSSKYFQFNTGLPGQNGGAALASGDEIIWSKLFYRTPTTASTITLSKINPYTGIIYSKDFAQLDILAQIRRTVISPDGSIYCTGSKTHSDNRFLAFLGKFSASGEIGCPSVPVSATFGNGSATATNIIMNTNSKSFTLISTGTTSAYIYNITDSICTLVNNCDTIRIHGNDTICNMQQEVFFTAFKRPTCAYPVIWQIDPTAVSLFQPMNDTTLKLVFNQSWQGYLYARIETSCNIFTDSIFLTILHSPGPVNIGPDVSLCAGNSRLLNAHTGYSSYRWQDASTDSILTVSSPGLYWVEVTDTCNNTFRDSVFITAAPPVPLELGPGLHKCNKDSVTITAPPDFLNYFWSPNYNINSITGQNVIVFPDIDTTYYLTAEKTPGCFAFDSIRISVSNSPPVSLGADTSFCNGDSLTISAGPGFSNYNWSTGANTQQIVLKNPGVYSVIASAPNGCSSVDTIRVVNVYNTPSVNLGPDIPICDNSSEQLNAGGGYPGYLWNTGNTTPSIFVDTPGIYWVIVTDNNNCVGTDSMTVTGINAAPDNFLPGDTILCSYSSILLRPQLTFNNYLWNTGAVSQSITITIAGIYWLQVTNSDGCTGMDSIIVAPKQCLDGFYIPSAFTPNNDGKNDLIRPLLFGNVVKYNFRVYNRWGEVVFSTKDTNKGWDGRLTSTTSDTNVFVWHCNYQFENMPEQSKKGTFILIR